MRFVVYEKRGTTRKGQKEVGREKREREERGEERVTVAAGDAGCNGSSDGESQAAVHREGDQEGDLSFSRISRMVSISG